LLSAFVAVWATAFLFGLGCPRAGRDAGERATGVVDPAKRHAVIQRNPLENRSNSIRRTCSRDSVKSSFNGGSVVTSPKRLEDYLKARLLAPGGGVAINA
jgi:hypothetical protein